MSSTKIINVLRDDTPQEILDLFEQSDAQEVIFVLPKRGKFLSQPAHFTALADTAEKVGKAVSILCPNVQTNQAAREAGFHVLEPKKKASVATLIRATPPPQDPDIIDDSTDAYQDNVPSDEKVELPEEEDETTGMHIIEPEEEEEDDVIKSDSDVDEEEEFDDEKAIEEFYRNAQKQALKDADFTASPVSPNPSAKLGAGKYRLRSAVKSLTRASQIDGVVQPHPEDERSIRVQRKTEKPSPVEIFHANDQSRKGDRLFSKVWPSFSGRPSWKPGEKRSPRKKYLLITVVILGLIATGVYAYPESAVITLKPAPDNLDARVKIEIGDSIGTVDAVFNKIPGQLFLIEHTEKQEFPATGQKEVSQKARGKITVYNEYGTTPQTLISTTRFESEGGLIFRTLKTIIVPGTRVENGKITPGSINVEVVADKSGPTYNVPPGKFTIPAFKEKGDTNRFSKFYGQSTQAFTQGVNGMAKIITEADYANAKKVITDKLKNALAELVRTKTADLKTLGSEAPQIGEVSSTAQTDQAVDSFTMSLSGKVKVLGFKESQLHDFIAQYVKRTKGMIAKPEKITYTFNGTTIPADKNTTTTTLQLKGTIFAEVDIAKIISDLRGKSGDEIRIYLRDLQSITSAKVNINSLWRERVPDNPDRIRVEIQYD